MSSSLPVSEYVFVNPEHEAEIPTQVNIVATDQSNIQAQTWHSKHEYTSEDIGKAQSFIKNIVKPWVKLQREVACNRNQLSKAHTEDSRYRYPISRCNDNDTTSIMDDSQWIPFALTMTQSRKRFRSSIDNSFCEPMRMIIHGEGGSGKSWLIQHIVNDLHNVYREHWVSGRVSKSVLLLAHQGTAAFHSKGQTICSALQLTSFSRSAYSVPYTSLAGLKGGATTLKQLQQRCPLSYY